MADHTPEPASEPDGCDTTVARRGPDLLALAAGLAALGISTSALLGWSGWLPGIDGRWVLAAIAVVVGLVLVIGSIRPRRN